MEMTIRLVRKAFLITALGATALLGIVLQLPKSDTATSSVEAPLSSSLPVPPKQASPAPVVLPTTAVIEQTHPASEQRLTAPPGPTRRTAMKNMSDTATMRLPQTFSDFRLTDAQVQALVEAERRSSERLSRLSSQLQQAGAIDSSYDARQRAIDAARTDDFRRILGAQAYDAFEKKRDYRYQTLMQNAAAWLLEEQRLEKVYQLIRDYDRLANNYYREAFDLEEQEQLVDWAMLDMNLAQLSRTAHESLRALLGDAQYEQLKMSGALAPEHSTAAERISALHAALAERAPPVAGAELEE
jgi:hypothetical protein